MLPVNFVSWRIAISMPNASNAQHEDSSPPFLPFRIFHVAMEKVPLPPGPDGACSGESMPAAAHTRTYLIFITQPLELPQQRCLQGLNHYLLSPWMHVRGSQPSGFLIWKGVIAIAIVTCVRCYVMEGLTASAG